MDRLCPCGKPIVSKVKTKKFCSMACYVASPGWRKRMLANMAAGRVKGKGPARKGATLPCEQCSKPFYRRESSTQRFCSRPCYRTWMAVRFDQHIDTVLDLRKLNNFDEFLSQERLPCLVRGCEWVGDNLGQHLAQSHCTLADDFKRRVGFNVTTGLVSPRLHMLLKSWNRNATPPDGRSRGRHGDGPLSREAREHYAKAMAVRQLEKP